MAILSTVALLATLQAQPFEADFENVLSTIGLTTETARFDQTLVELFVPNVGAPLFRAAHRDPWKLPHLVGAMQFDLANHFDHPHETLRAGMRTLGYQVRRSLIDNPNAKAEADARLTGSLAKTLSELKQSGIIRGEIPSAAVVPAEVQQAASLVLSTAVRTVKFRRLALKGAPKVDELFSFLAASGAEDLDGEPLDQMLRLPSQIDRAYLAAAAHDLFLASKTASEWIAKVPATNKYAFDVETQWGWISLRGGANDRYADRPTLLILDTGGDDVYLNAPRTASASNWASVVLDTNGADTYVSDATLASTELVAFAGRKSGGAIPGPGGAILGVAYLGDLKGNDVYRSHRPGLGSGRFGFACVFDEEGDDLYDAYRDCQGFGHYGAGLLMDTKGDDRYRCFQQGQGCGLTDGFGLLRDHSGSDDYVAEDSVIDFPSPQDAKHNVSMAQGAGNGRRADYSDGHSLPGGIGLLLDAEGKDHYKCGIFGQGVGYWQGLGMLVDSGGQDLYEGQWYVQGASAHFAIGYLEDKDGDDEYRALLNMAQGAGHDFSIGFLLDKAGNDRYLAPNLSLGAGNANGIGICVEVSGNDAYQSSGLTLGKAAAAPKFELRSRALTLGMFMDLGGTDSYPESAVQAGDARRQATWTERLTRAYESQVGVFYDR